MHLCQRSSASGGVIASRCGLEKPVLTLLSSIPCNSYGIGNSQLSEIAEARKGEGSPGAGKPGYLDLPGIAEIGREAASRAAVSAFCICSFPQAAIRASAGFQERSPSIRRLKKPLVEWRTFPTVVADHFTPAAAVACRRPHTRSGRAGARPRAQPCQHSRTLCCPGTPTHSCAVFNGQEEPQQTGGERWQLCCRPGSTRGWQHPRRFCPGLPGV